MSSNEESVRTVNTFAKSVFKNLRSQGYGWVSITTVVTEILGLLLEDQVAHSKREGAEVIVLPPASLPLTERAAEKAVASR